MHLVTIEQPVALLGTDRTLPAGSWICDDRNAFEIGLMAGRGEVAVTPWVNSKDSLLNSPKNILLIRSGAIGDLLLLTPAIIALQMEMPTAKISLCCHPKHFPVVQDLLGKDGLVEYPLAARLPPDYDAIVPLENVIELARETHATDAFADALELKIVEVPDGYRPHYEVSDDEKAWAMTTYPKEKKRVVLHLRASTQNRDYPFPLWAQIIKGLLDAGHEVFLFAGRGQITPFKPLAGLHDCSHLSFREAAALLSTADAFAGVDSCFIHLCHALDIPAIGLFAVFPWQIRTGKAPKTHVLQAAGDCAPCQWLSQVGSPFPPNGPCQKTGFCSVLASIEPERVVSKLKALLHE